mmetsp:Transcript_14273/g.42576  ORF Transcript_14273/g.42576 Transcript_14273/m.42576 type:complete len:409 (-) Transcript_14273:15-1241(-)
MAAITADATVRILEPPAGDAFAKFRGRLGRARYPVPGADAWVVAVERLETERATSHVICQPENAFEFLPLAPGALEVVEGAARAPSYSPAERYVTDGRAPPDARERPAAARVAVVVPYRDLHVEQARAAHLARFVPHMARFLAAHCADYRIVVVEQSNDGRKFNRGQLLNAGALLAKDRGCDSLIFHDVDLLPSDELGPWYRALPLDDRPCHLARVWDRYSGNPDYFGGVAAWTVGDFDRINGFPNNFWGWGGEDDEMMRRAGGRAGPLGARVEAAAPRRASRRPRAGQDGLRRALRHGGAVGRRLRGPRGQVAGGEGGIPARPPRLEVQRALGAARRAPRDLGGERPAPGVPGGPRIGHARGPAAAAAGRGRFVYGVPGRPRGEGHRGPGAGRRLDGCESRGGRRLI